MFQPQHPLGFQSIVFNKVTGRSFIKRTEYHSFKISNGVFCLNIFYKTIIQLFYEILISGCSLSKDQHGNYLYIVIYPNSFIWRWGNKLLIILETCIVFSIIYNQCLVQLFAVYGYYTNNINK